MNFSSSEKQTGYPLNRSKISLACIRAVAHYFSNSFVFFLGKGRCTISLNNIIVITSSTRLGDRVANNLMERHIPKGYDQMPVFVSITTSATLHRQWVFHWGSRYIATHVNVEVVETIFDMAMVWRVDL